MATTRKKSARKSIIASELSKPPSHTSLLSWPQTAARIWQWEEATPCKSPGKASMINIDLSFCIHKQFHPLAPSDKQINWNQGAEKKLKNDHRHLDRFHWPSLGAEIDSMTYDRRMTNMAGKWLCHAINASQIRVIAPPHHFTTANGSPKPDGEHITVGFPRGSTIHGPLSCHVYLRRHDHVGGKFTILQVTRVNRRRMECLRPVPNTT